MGGRKEWRKRGSSDMLVRDGDMERCATNGFRAWCTVAEEG